MGYMRHHAIVVSSWDKKLIAKAHEKACQIFGSLASEIVESKMNGYRSFFVAPDGSKEGWDDSAEGDKNRDAFVKWTEQFKYDDGSTSLCWVEVQFADDEGETKVIRDSDESWRTARAAGT